MKVRIRFAKGINGITHFIVTLCILCSVGLTRAQSIPFALKFWYPTNGEAFYTPANIGLHALATDSNIVEAIQYYSGSTLIGTVTNTGGVLLTNMSQDSPFYMLWSNVLAGSYTLTAVGIDSVGNMATSPPVNITVTNPVIRPSVYIYSPTNGAKYLSLANLTLYARATENGGTVTTVDFFANSISLGVVSNSSQMVFTNISSEPLFPFSWSNVLTGNYALTAVATDQNGNSSTSSVVDITVTTNLSTPLIPFNVAFIYPTNGQSFNSPAYIVLHPGITDTNPVGFVEYYSGGNLIGLSTNNGVLLTNLDQYDPFVIVWSNVTAGAYSLTAVVQDEMGNWATSPSVNITVKSPTNSTPPPIPFDVGFFYPTNGETYTTPANVGLHAWVTDSNEVWEVEFFSNGDLIGYSTNNGVLLTNTIEGSPFYLTWSNAPAGIYNLTALAFDERGNMATSAPVNITVSGSITNPPPPPVPFIVSFFYPTNGQMFTAPASIGVHARVTDSNLVEAVQYFANGSFIGVVTNTSTVLLTNSTQANPFFLDWSNVPAGLYSVTAVALDSAGNLATSSVVNITVYTPTNPTPPFVPFAIGFKYPTNGQVYLAPADIALHAWATDSNLVKAIEYFFGGTYLGTVTNQTGVLLTNMNQGNPFVFYWDNVPTGNYSLTAVALDSTGNTATSAPVNITVTNPPPVLIPFAASFFYPTNGQVFLAPANIGVHARVTDSNVVETVQYFSNGTLLGIVTNTSGVVLTNTSQGNPFFLDWSNVLAGIYTLTALATDSAGNTASSAPENIYVFTNLPPAVSIYTPDPVAVEGTNCPNVFTPATCVTNYISGTNTATFLVHRNTGTNSDLTVYYCIGGTATNGVDYETIPNWVTIPVGMTYALIPIVPLNSDSSYRSYDTVILKLMSSTNVPPNYIVGSPSSAGAVILEGACLPITRSMINSMLDGSLYLSLPATNGMNYSFQVSSDTANWLSVCTNTVLKGSAQFVDPNGAVSPSLYYRIVPVSTPATY